MHTPAKLHLREWQPLEWRVFVLMHKAPLTQIRTNGTSRANIVVRVELHVWAQVPSAAVASARAELHTQAQVPTTHANGALHMSAITLLSHEWSCARMGTCHSHTQPCAPGREAGKVRDRYTRPNSPLWYYVLFCMLLCLATADPSLWIVSHYFIFKAKSP